MVVRTLNCFDSWTLFWGWLNANEWGKGPGASRTIEDNIMKINYWEIQDKTSVIFDCIFIRVQSADDSGDYSNGNSKCGMFADIPRIIKDIKKNGAKLAIVSRNTSKAL